MASTVAPPSPPASAAPVPSTGARLAWFDVLRGLVMLWILVFHYASDTGPLPPVGPDVVERALDGLADFGNLLLANAHFAVHLFLFASGAGLAMSRARRPGPARPGFWRERLTRIGVGYAVALPLIFGALAACAVWRAIETDTGLRAQFEQGATIGVWPYPVDGEAIASALLFVPRLLGGEDAYQAPPPTAWFLVPLVQLYLLFPLLWWLRERIGAVALVAACFAVAYGARQLTLDELGYHWTLVLGPCRLAEFGLGVALGPLLWRLRSPWLLLLIPPAIFLWMQGASDQGDRLDGVVRANLLVAAGLPAVVIALSMALARIPRLSDGLGWIGRRTLELLLVQDAVRFAVTTWLATGHSIGARAPVCVMFVAVVLALAAGFGRVTGWVERRAGHARAP